MFIEMLDLLIWQRGVSLAESRWGRACTKILDKLVGRVWSRTLDKVCEGGRKKENTWPEEIGGREKRTHGKLKFLFTFLFLSNLFFLLFFSSSSLS